MKTIVPVRKHAALIMPMAILALAICLVSFGTAGNGVPAPYSTEGKDTITVQKLFRSKKYRIRLYPNANHEVLFFNASGQQGRIYQLFLFDLEGKMVKQVLIRNKETVAIDSMEKGNYLFEVFSDDERIENGQVIIK